MNITNHLKILGPALVVLFFSLTGCVTLYKPNNINSPMLKDKGDLNATASLGLSGAGIFNMQSSYAISNHIGIMANGMFHFRSRVYNDSSYERLNIASMEAGAGYFTPINDKGTTTFQVYGGLGYGTSNDKITSEANPPNQVPQISSRYLNVFLQPGVVFHGNNTQIALDARINYVNIHRIKGYLYQEFDWWNTDFNFVNDTSLSFLNVEPVMSLTTGSRNVRGIFQFGFILPMVQTTNYFKVNNASYLLLPLIKLSAGIRYQIKRKSDIAAKPKSISLFCLAGKK